MYDAKRAEKLLEFMKPDVIYSVEDLDIFQDDLCCQGPHVAKRGVTPGMIVISCEHKMLLGE